MIDLICRECKKEFKTYPSRVRTGRKYCSQKCSNKSLKRKMLGNTNKKHTEKTRAHLSRLNIGKNNPRWKGGITAEMSNLRCRAPYRHWRIAVFERDNYVCVACEGRRELHAHHVDSFYRIANKRYSIDNGLTLCIYCHSNLHGFPVGNLTVQAVSAGD